MAIETNEQYQRTLKRARDAGVTIVGDTVSPDGRRAWSVYNPKYEDGWYTVRQEPGAATYSCNCEAGRRGISYPCKHVAKVIEDERRPLSGPRQAVGAMRADRLQAIGLWW